MNVLIACEESQTVCKAFRDRGFNAFSCDVQECSGGHPEWHIRGDARSVLDGGDFTTQDGSRLNGINWDIIIAHPPCTFLTITGNRWFNENVYGESAKERKKEREEAYDFFIEFTRAPCKHIAIENPVGVISTRYRKPDQIVHPWQFGDDYEKTTCLWLFNLPKLKVVTNKRPELEWCEWVDGKTGRKKRQARWYACAKHDQRGKIRSKTFPGIAAAMAEQWGDYIRDGTTQTPMQISLF